MSRGLDICIEMWYSKNMLGVIDNPNVLAQRFPASMTGKKLRKQLGIPEKLRIIAEKGMKVKAKFKGIKQKNRLSYLRKMSKKIIIKRSLDEIHDARNGFNSHKLSSLPLSEKSLCYCCVKNHAVVRHHVIQLQHGGRNRRNNIVPLCNNCHIKLHPHMQKKPKSKLAEIGRLPLGTALPQNNGPIVVNPKRDNDNIAVVSA